MKFTKLHKIKGGKNMLKKVLNFFQGTKPNSESVQSSNDDIVIPIEGTLLSLTEVPDEVFSQKMMGDGFAIKPENGAVVSPVNGQIVNVFPTKHAIGIEAANGKEILIHFGIDTVNLKGEGFNVQVNQGDKVTAGQKLMDVDLSIIEAKAKSIITPIIFTNLAPNEIINIDNNVGQKVSRGEKNIISIKN